VTRRAPRRALAVVVAGVLGLVLSACSGAPGTGDANFPTGESAVTEVAVDDREDPVAFAGESLQGEPLDLADYRGEVVVLNYWGAWCNPCRDEAPVLQEASEQLDAVFLGAQYREDNLGNALAFEREFDIDYPTFHDSGASMFELGSYAPRFPPSTVVLDREGRVAALISGVVPSVATLEGVVEEAGRDG
jgi:thiol-disulfide isomerase/thioredoxin